MSKKELNYDLIRCEQLHTNSIEDHVRERIYSHVVWTPSEDLYRTRDMCFCRTTVDPKDVPPTKFTTALNRKVRSSFIGCFLKELNSSQKQEKEVQEHKLRMLEFDWNCHWDDTIYLENDICNDVLGLIREAVNKSQGAIGSQEVVLLLDTIRLVDCMITDIDEDIKNLRNLKALSLSANWITTLYGGHLPSSLEFLDLYGNFISDVTSLSCDLPEWLLHLGLGRNRLSDRSALHLLTGNGTSNLRSVDLEDNNLCDLAAVLHTMKELRHLVALHLKGNPCSTCHGYKRASLQMLPRLEYLDNMEVWSVDRELPPDYHAIDHVTSGTLLFQCFRLMGLPQPLPEKMGNKKIMQTYHLEVELPLLEHKLRSREEPPEFEEWKPKEEDKIQNDIDREKYARKNNVKNGNKDKQGKGKYSIEKEKPFQDIVNKKKVIKEKTKVKDEKQSKANGGGKTSASVERENTVKYNVEDKDLHKEHGKTKNELDIGRATRMEAERNKRPSVFPDTRMSILKNVSKECELNVEEALTKRRHIPCFKTEKIPWSKIIEYPDPSIEVPTPNDDLEALRDTMRSSVRARIVFMQWLEPDKVKAPKQKTGEPKLPPKDPLEEIILRREVVAEFDTHLEQVDWSERTVDYTWSLEGDQVPVRANKATDRLKDLLYDAPQKAAKRPPNKTGEPTLASAPLALPIPEAITCHFGFGLKRI